MEKLAYENHQMTPSFLLYISPEAESGCELDQLFQTCGEEKPKCRRRSRTKTSVGGAAAVAAAAERRGVESGSLKKWDKDKTRRRRLVSPGLPRSPRRPPRCRRPALAGIKQEVYHG